VVKKDGGWRELSILTVSDRVLQRAALNVMMPAFEQIFLEGSYGYRPQRNVAQAVEKVLEARDEGYRWVLDADIDSCFDNLDHSRIMGGVRQVVSNSTLLRLIELWLEAGRKPGPRKGDAEVGSEGEKGKQRKTGVPLGAVISPLLCNLALHQLDLALERAGWPWVRYADDFVVLTRTEAEALAAWDVVETALTVLQLQLEMGKTWVTSFDRGFKFLGVVFEGDGYWYVRQGQRIEGRGREVDVLSERPPEGYDQW
jgi:group II intron reverse transcriptase/maturase